MQPPAPDCPTVQSFRFTERNASPKRAFACSASRMIDLVRTMVTKVGVPLHEAIVMATDTPAFVIGLTGKGQFKIGDAADLVVISPELEVLRTFIAGEEVFRR